jgi:hypothetical protein
MRRCSFGGGIEFVCWDDECKGSDMEIWKLRGRNRYFVRFAPEDTLVFDLRRLTADQKRRVDEACPEYRGITSLGDHLVYERVSGAADQHNR